MQFNYNYFHLDLISLFVSLIIFYLSLWIVIPAPNLILLRLSVGIPEISLWLTVVIFLILTVNLVNFNLNFNTILVIILNLISGILTLLPLIQLPKTNHNFQQEFINNFGDDFLEEKTKNKPFSFQKNFTGIRIPEVRIKRDIIFAEVKDIKLKLNVYNPLKKGIYPTLIVIYGGAWKHGLPSQNEQFSRYFAHQGYTVIAISYRHAPKYKFPCQLNDVKLAFEYINKNAEKLEVNLEKIAIMGRSAGGQLAKISAYDHNINNILNFKGVIGYYSPVDLTQAYYFIPIPDPINTRPILLDFLGDTPDNLPELYQQASPINYVKSNLPPTLLIYGKRDYIVPAKAGEKLTNKLLNSKNKVIFLEIPWADHCFDAVFFGISNQLALFYTEKFLAEVLN